MGGIIFLGPTWGSSLAYSPVAIVGGDFWYDASAGRYFQPGGLASGGTVTAWTSRFASGVVVPVSGFFPYGSGNYSLPNFYFAGNATNISNVASFSAYTSNSSTTNFNANIVPDSSTSNITATMTVTSVPSAAIQVGVALSGASVKTGTYVLKNLSGSGNGSTWTVTVPQGTYQNALTNVAMTGTYAVMNVTSVTSGVISAGDLVYKSANISGNTYVSADSSLNSNMTGAGGTGTYLINIPQTQGSAGTPITGYTSQVPFVGFNSGDAFRVPMYANNRTLSGYTMFFACKFGTVAGTVSACGSTHGNGGDLSFTNSAGTWTYNVAGATANGASSNTNWLIHTLVFDGTKANNSTRFRAYINGVQQNLTFTGTVGATTTAPANISITGTSTGTSYANGTATLGYATTGSPAFVAGDTIVVAGYVPTGYNGTYNVVSCNNTSVSYSLGVNPGNVTSYGTISGTPIPNLMVSGKAPMTAAGTNTNRVTASQGLNIGEIIVYGNTLDDITRQSTEKYLRQKWLGIN